MIRAKGYATHGPQSHLIPFSFDRREPNQHEIVIDIHYCGICHSDIHQARDEWGGSTFPMVPGHEISGIVRTVGSKVTQFKVGDAVGVGCFVDSCGHCVNCKSTQDQYCLEGVTLTYNGYEKDGKTPTYGGYSNVIVVNENHALKIPPNLDLAQAAPLLCAGVTLYSPLKHWQAGPGKKVAIMGLGGLGHVGLKIAKSMGAEVTILSHSAKKYSDALRMGADHFICTEDSSVFQKHAYSFDLIINTISAEIDINLYLSLLKLDGTLVSVGIPQKPLVIHPFSVIGMRRRYAGSAIGSIKETQEVLDLCARHGITTEIELISPHQINEAYDRVLKSDVRYRFVIDLKKLD
jgi:uncharacterized zinc-type alcohol dehydrogenase-like protein